jgi:hypothetical protein
MAEITEIVPQQNFETVLYKIAAILFTELTNQRSAHDNMPEFSVFIERMTPYDKAENVMINVTTRSINYGSFTESDSQGKTDFNIEIYAPLEHTSINASDSSKKFTLHKVAGIIRYILSSTKYVVLGLPYGLIGGTYVESLQFFDDFNNQDGANIRTAILGFSVRVQENQQLWQGVEIFSNTSEVKLDQTDLGYKLIKNN